MLTRFAAAVAGATALITGTACSQSAPTTPELLARWKDASLYDVKVKSLEGDPVDLGQYHGKVTLVVNVASRCGYTPQYEGLQKLQERFKDRGLVVLGFPSGDFGGQELGTAKEIREFCDTRFRVTFPMFEKCVVKAGEGQSPVYECLGTKTGELPSWNFGKYVVSRDGKSAVYFGSNAAPDSAKLIEAIEKALAESEPARAPKAPTPPATAPTDKPSADNPKAPADPSRVHPAPSNDA